MSPSPLGHHNAVGFTLATRLPDELEVILDMEVDLELVPPDEPDSVRRPDLIEVLSPSSRRVDYHAERHEYAGAGIPFYWLVDLDEPVSLAALISPERSATGKHLRRPGSSRPSSRSR